MQPLAGRLRQRGQAGQEAGERLAGAGGGNQQRMAARLRRRQHLQLVQARNPAALGEPAGYGRRQRRRYLQGPSHLPVPALVIFMEGAVIVWSMV